MTTVSAIAPKVLNLAILLVGARFVARALPPDGFGVWLLLITASGLLGFADLGLGNGLLNEVAAAHGRDDLAAQRRAISSAPAALVLVSALLVGAFAVTIPFVQWSQLLGVEGASASSVTAAVAVFVIATAVAVVFGAAPKVRLALQTGWVNNTWGAAGGVISLSVVVIGAPVRRVAAGPRRRGAGRTTAGRRCRHGRALRSTTAGAAPELGMDPSRPKSSNSAARAPCSASWRWRSLSGTSPTHW